MAKRDQLTRTKPSSQLLTDTRRMATGNFAEIERLESEIHELQKQAIVVGDGKYRFRNLEFSQIGFALSDKEIEPQEWLDVFYAIKGLDDAVQWAIGDLIAYAEMKYGQSYAQLAEITGYTVQTLQTYAYVAKRVEILTRVKDLSFSHHRIVAKFVDDNQAPDGELQAYWLGMAFDNGWTRAELEAAIKQSERDDTPDKMQSVTEDSWLFDKEQKPNLNYLQKQWAAARHGDEGARDRLREQVEATRQWLNEVMDSLDG